MSSRRSLRAMHQTPRDKTPRDKDSPGLPARLPGTRLPGTKTPRDKDSPGQRLPGTHRLPGTPRKTPRDTQTPRDSPQKTPRDRQRLPETPRDRQIVKKERCTRRAFSFHASSSRTLGKERREVAPPLDARWPLLNQRDKPNHPLQMNRYPRLLANSLKPFASATR